MEIFRVMNLYFFGEERICLSDFLYFYGVLGTAILMMILITFV